jgi:drug/metabolite transporter (DMT)-like permease
MSISKPQVASSSLKAAVYALGLLIFGSLNTLTMKGELSMKSIGLSGNRTHFSKPWFANLDVFFACTLVLLYDFSSRWLSRKRKTLLSNHLLQPDAEASPQAPPERPYWVKVSFVSIPAAIDVVATGLGCASMMFVPASLWQMMRGSMIVFSAFFSIMFLNRRMLCYNWLGICICILGVIVVGYASLMEGGSSQQDADNEQQSALIIGIAMLLLGQVFQAAQMVLEEWLLKEVQMEGMQVIGWEGAWGFLFVLAGYPVLYALPGSDNGHLEDPVDTVEMLKNSLPLFLMVMTYTFSCATYNVAGISVTGCLSAVHRVLIEASRTVVVWTVGLFIHYCIDADSVFGESWSPGCYMRLAGFVLLTLGQATYGGLVKWPFLSYPPENEASCAKHKSPSAMVNMITPLPLKTEGGSTILLE